jgi:hypothetical protein
MEALSLIPFSLDNLGEEVKPKAWRERLLEVVRRVIEFFQDVADTPILGISWPIILSLVTFGLIVACIYLTGWEHSTAGP